MNLHIPTRRVPGFRRLKNYRDEEMKGILDALSKARPASTITNLATQIAQATGRPAEELKEVLSALGGLYLLLESREVGIPSLVKDVCEALAASSQSDFTFDEASGESFQKGLTEALSYKGVLGITAKALDIFLEEERVFCTARLITDIRPIFPIHTEENPNEVIFVHTLKIRYHHSDEQQPMEFFVAMDGDDIDKLMAVLERGKRKQKALKTVLQNGKLNIIEGGHGCA